MIEELRIIGLGVIEDATLALSEGLTVVTGETGAGKTMVVTAVQLLLGERADSGLVRRGHDAAVVEAVIRTPDGATHTVEREVLASGGSRVRIDGRPATVSALRELIGGWVVVHAQHEHTRLGDPAVQRRLLDRYAGPAHTEALAGYRHSYARWRELLAERDRLETEAADRARERERLEAEIAAIAAAAVDPVRDAELPERLALAEAAEELALGTAEAERALGPEGAEPWLEAAVAVLRRIPAHTSELEQLRERAEALAVEARELARDLRRFREAHPYDPEEVEELRRRLMQLRGLERRFGTDLEGLLRYADEAAVRVEELRNAEDRRRSIDAELAELRAQVTAGAAALHAARVDAARRLAAEVTARLADLGMPHARFEIRVEPVPEHGPEGADRVEFLLAPNPGDEVRPLDRAVSGGERSRAALAVEVALAEAEDARVLVFDEVDAGVGGATALAVGEQLARLAHTGSARQVLCVTHLAQLAAFADVHHTVIKSVRRGRAVTEAVRVEDRAAELARMMSGDPGAPEALEHARTLLAEASRRAGSLASPPDGR